MRIKEDFIQLSRHFREKEKKLFSFFFEIAMANFFKITHQDKIKITSAILKLERPPTSADFIHPNGMLFKYFIFFNHENPKIEEISITNTPPPLTNRNHQHIKLRITNKIYGTCSSTSILKKITNRVLYAQPLKIPPHPPSLDIKERKDLYKHLRLKGNHRIDAKLFTALLPTDFLELPKTIQKKIDKIEFHGNAYELAMNPSILFLSKNDPKLTGYQHGGVYNEWQQNIYENLEKEIYDEFNEWHKTGITRFNKILNPFNKKNKIDEIIWIYRQRVNTRYMQQQNKNYIDHITSTSHIKKIKEVLASTELKVKIKKHPRTSPLEYEAPPKTNHEVIAGNLEKYLSREKLALFDCLSHTLIYFCIKYKIPFSIITPIPKKGVTPYLSRQIKNLSEIGILIDAELPTEQIKTKLNTLAKTWSDVINSEKYLEILYRKTK